jgi:ribosomal protein L7Ae-like RNA K-turn-binding protein
VLPVVYIASDVEKNVVSKLKEIIKSHNVRSWNLGVMVVWLGDGCW